LLEKSRQEAGQIIREAERKAAELLSEEQRKVERLASERRRLASIANGLTSITNEVHEDLSAFLLGTLDRMKGRGGSETVSDETVPDETASAQATWLEDAV
jgi:cell division septum initiation protein DivIVA